MSENKLQRTFVLIGGKKLDFSAPIEKLIKYHKIFLVLLNPDSNMKEWGQFKNLIGVDEQGTILWKADLPTTITGDTYHSLEIRDDKIYAYSWCSYECCIDPVTGKILNKTFTK